MKRDKLNVMVCLPCDHLQPNDRFIVVRASDGNRTQFIKFGRNTSMKMLMSQIPIGYMDRT